MNILVFKQLFSSWRSGIWIVLELVVLFVLLYIVLGWPLSCLYKDIAYARGYQLREDVVVVPADKAVAGDLASWPGVKECEPAQEGMFPSGRWFNGASVGPDSASMVHCYVLWRPETKALSDMIGYEYVYPEGGPDWDNLGDKSMIISSDLAEHFFGSPWAAVGGVLHVGGDYNISLEVAAVARPLRFSANDVPKSSLLLPYCVVDGHAEAPQCYFLSLYNGEDPESLVADLNRNLNCGADTYADLLQLWERDVNEDAGAILLAVFLFIVFNMLLCTLSFFYLRVKIRTDEVGVRLACGASHTSITGLFIREGLVLALVASLAGMAITLNLTTYPGFLASSTTPLLASYDATFNTPVTWYLAVSAAAMLAVAAISALSSALASSVLMNMSVADAFREE